MDPPDDIADPSESVFPAVLQLKDRLEGLTKGRPLLSLSGTGDHWFTLRGLFLYTHSETAVDFLTAESLSKTGRDVKDTRESEETHEDTSNQTPHKAVDFLNHITISRDQTRERQKQDQSLALKALLDTKTPDSVLRTFYDSTEQPDRRSVSSSSSDSSPRIRVELPRGEHNYADSFHSDDESQAETDNNSAVSSGYYNSESSEDYLEAIENSDDGSQELYDGSQDSDDGSRESKARSSGSSSISGRSSGRSEDPPTKDVRRLKLPQKMSKDYPRRIQALPRRSADADSPRYHYDEVPGPVPQTHHWGPLPPSSGEGRAKSNTVSRFAQSNNASGPLPAPVRVRSSHDSDRNELPTSPYSGGTDEEAIKQRIDDLTRELEALKSELHGPSEKELPPNLVPDMAPITWRKVYRIRNKPYLGKPEWRHGDGGLRLGASMPIRDINSFIERHDELLFLVYEDYKFASPSDYGITESDGLDVLPLPKPSTESIWIAYKAVSQALTEFSKLYPDFETVFPNHDFEQETHAPYLVFFYMFSEWEAKVSQISDEDNYYYVEAVFKYLEQSMASQYREVLRQLESGKILPGTLAYLVKPGEIIMRPKPYPAAFMASSWPKFLGIYNNRRKNRTGASWGPDTNDGSTGKRQSSSRGKQIRTHQYTIRSSRPARFYDSDEDGTAEPNDSKPLERASDDRHELWTVDGWNWDIKAGRLSRHNETLELRIDPRSREPLDISQFGWYPLRYASQEHKDLLMKRGHTFWRCRERQFVGYSYEADDLESANERFVIDFATYRKLHPETTRTKRSHKSEQQDAEEALEEDILEQENPPQDASIALFPSVLVGFNLRLKKWVDIEVDRIQDVDWNKKAFENLVVEEDTKHLVKALISNQIKAEASTDLISGKGNGLIILLHGGPGTGKTFTAESVAELAEKPLYRVTCGDIGTKPEEVEKYLETVLLLGKIWGCVVLLDEADVFLEERSLTDLKRNALVSVFLRVLEYYDGILILTSNRVGTFDQAFKSRIQLALHYENLKKPQRRKIWRNFFARLRDLGEPETEVDYDDLNDHIDDLAEGEMNGRQIRNAMTTARQLAQFDGKKLSYVQLQHVISVAGRFEGYLNTVRQGYTDDQLARDDGLR